MTLGNNGRPGDWLGSRGQQPSPHRQLSCSRKWARFSCPTPTPTPEALTPPGGVGRWAFPTRSVGPAGCVPFPRSGQGGAPLSWGKKRPVSERCLFFRDYFKSLSFALTIRSLYVPFTRRCLPSVAGPLTVTWSDRAVEEMGSLPLWGSGYRSFIFISFSSSLRMTSARLETTFSLSMKTEMCG